MKKIFMVPLLSMVSLSSALAGAAYDRGIEQYEDAIKFDNDGQHRKAFLLVEASAKNGYPPAQNWLGDMYRRGHGVDQSCAMALKWFHDAAENDNINGKVNIGKLHDEGECVPLNDAKAIEWYKEAAMMGHEYSKNQAADVGVMYFKGEGVIQDYKQAYIWLAVAAAEGHEQARGWMTRSTFFLNPEILADAQEKARELYSEIYGGAAPNKKVRD